MPCSNLQRCVCEIRILCSSALQTTWKRGMCSSISLRPTPIVLLPLHLPAGVRHDAEQLARNAQSEGRLPGFDATQSRPKILQVVFSSLSPCTASLSPTILPRCTLPLLHILAFSSLSCARLPAVHRLLIQGLELTVPPTARGGGWCNPLQEEGLGIFAASPCGGGSRGAIPRHPSSTEGERGDHTIAILRKGP